MLVLSRDIGQKIIINNNILVTILSVNNKQVKIGIEAPKNIRVDREEIFNKIKEIGSSELPTHSKAAYAKADGRAF